MAVLLDLDLHDGVDFPDGAACLENLIRVLRVEEQPAADAHRCLTPGELFHLRQSPLVHGTNARGCFDHDGVRAIFPGGFRQPDVPVSHIRCRGMAVGKLGTGLPGAKEISFCDDGNALVLCNRRRVFCGPGIHPTSLGRFRPCQIDDGVECDRHVIPFINAIFQHIQLSVATIPLRRAALECGTLWLWLIGEIGQAIGC